MPKIQFIKGIDIPEFFVCHWLHQKWSDDYRELISNNRSVMSYTINKLNQIIIKCDETPKMKCMLPPITMNYVLFVIFFLWLGKNQTIKQSAICYIEPRKIYKKSQRERDRNSSLITFRKKIIQKNYRNTIFVRSVLDFIRKLTKKAKDEMLAFVYYYDICIL